MVKRAIQVSIGLAIGLGLLWLLFRDTNWHEVGTAIREIHIGWFLIAQIPLWLSFPIRVQRWTYIVRVAKPVSFKNMFSATQIGFLANFTLPGRAGEAIRALVLTRLADIKFSKSFAMVALDRVTDLFGLIAVILVAIVAYQPEQDVTIPAETFGTPGAITFSVTQYRIGAISAGVFLFIVVGAFAFLYVNRSIVIRLTKFLVGLVSKTLAQRLCEMLDHFADGLHIFRSPVDMSKSILFSLLTWGTSLVFLTCMLEAFGIDYPWYTGVVMQAILSFFISAPGAPGFVGQFHVPIVITLVMLVPGIDVDRAKAVAIVIHLLNLPPIGILGVHALLTEHVGLFQLRKESRALQADEKAQAED